MKFLINSPVKLDPLLGDLVFSAAVEAAAPGPGTVAVGIVALVVLDHLCIIRVMSGVLRCLRVLAHLLKV